jgi:hypothetical protein
MDAFDVFLVADQGLRGRPAERVLEPLAARILPFGDFLQFLRFFSPDA